MIYTILAYIQACQQATTTKFLVTDYLCMCMRNVCAYCGCTLSSNSCHIDEDHYQHEVRRVCVCVTRKHQHIHTVQYCSNQIVINTQMA